MRERNDNDCVLCIWDELMIAVVLLIEMLMLMLMLEMLEISPNAQTHVLSTRRLIPWEHTLLLCLNRTQACHTCVGDMLSILRTFLGGTS